jgi:aconitate hydratase
MREYLVATGRKDVADLAVKNMEHLSADREVYTDPSRYYDQYIEINLSELEPYINGPFTPDLATPLSRMKEEAVKNNWPVEAQIPPMKICQEQPQW